jgi:hypothetical protein
VAVSAGLLSVLAAALRIVSAALDRPGQARKHADRISARLACCPSRSRGSGADHPLRVLRGLALKPVRRIADPQPARRRRAIHWPRALLHDMGEFVG